MDDVLNRPIKALIDEYPALGPCLEAFGVGCVPCAVGTCLLKDIVDIHRLPAEDEQSLMRRIAAIVHPGREIVLPPRAPRADASGAANGSPPMRKLVAEHAHITRWAALISRVAASADVSTEEGRALIMAGVAFIREYADRYHHAKEEDILFGYFDAALDILQVMRADHDTARAHVRAILEGVERRDGDAVRSRLLAYGELLREHIRKEDEILYPWMERQLTDHQIGEIHARFQETDDAFGDMPERQERFIATLEQRLGDTRPGRTEIANETINERGVP